MKKYLIFVIALFFVQCTKDTIEPEVFGNIDGLVISDETQNGLEGVSITTTPPTSAILTNGDGSFRINEIPEGNYTIQARKPGYISNSVSIFVREDRTAEARIFMELDDDESTAANSIEANINRVYNYVQDDSNYVQVDYEVFNSSNDITIPQYEVYFRVYAASEIFTEEINGENLEPRQRTFGTFDKLTFQNPSDSVVVFEIWTPED